jgi:hypothetical protein
MKTIKEQYKEIVSGFNDERTENVANRCVEIAEEIAIRFAFFLSDNMYEDMYQDKDGDGRNWVTYKQEGFDNYSTAEKFTIQELLEIFKKSQKL